MLMDAPERIWTDADGSQLVTVLTRRKSHIKYARADLLTAVEAERDAARAQVERLERRDGLLRACIRVNFMRNSNMTHAEIDAVIDAALAEEAKP